MNIIIPIGGKGERFSTNGYKDPKPLIAIFGKPMILHVLDNMRILANDKIFIIYYNLQEYGFEDIIREKYPNIVFITLDKQTKGAAETIYLGLCKILNRTTNKKTMLFDCDTFYSQDVISKYRGCEQNAIFYVENTDPLPIFSYINIDTESNMIKDIKEKQKISDFANTGIYCFSDISWLYHYSKDVVNNDIEFNGECYTSCIIAEMLDEGHPFYPIKLDPNYVFNLGTPLQLDTYKKNTFIFLFDLDGTLVNTEKIYYAIWKEILSEHKIILTKVIFETVISGNNDAYVFSKLISHISQEERDKISALKDELFAKHISNIKIIDGAVNFLYNIKRRGHKMAIVSNCNRATAELILKFLKIDVFFDTVVIGSECKRPKPYPDPYIYGMKYFGVSNNRVIIFEDSKSGILSARSASPRSLIGIKTLYSEKELLEIGVDLAIDNYIDYDIEKFIDYQELNINILKDYIRRSLNWDILDIKIDSDKLKGGFIADVMAVEITTRTETINCVLKIENESDTFLSKMSKYLILCSRENYFYDVISKYVPIKAPKFYGLIQDKDFNTIGILMENLNNGRFKLGLDLNKENINVSLKIIESMAKMHAKFWNYDLQKRFPELKKHNDTPFSPFCQDFINERFPLFKEKWSYLLSNEQMDFAKHIAISFKEIQGQMSDKNLTLCHGDIKSANIFFEILANGEYEPYFIDWQYTIMGKGVQDLVFLMIESFEPDIIQQYWTLFIEYYYIKLIENGVKEYSREEYENDFTIAAYYFPFFVAIWFGTVNEDELIDKNFPVFYIQKLLSFYRGLSG
jgi:hypothetical protein